MRFTPLPEDYDTSNLPNNQQPIRVRVTIVGQTGRRHLHYRRHRSPIVVDHTAICAERYPLSFQSLAQIVDYHSHPYPFQSAHQRLRPSKALRQLEDSSKPLVHRGLRPTLDDTDLLFNLLKEDLDLINNKSVLAENIFYPPYVDPSVDSLSSPPP